MLFLVKLAVSSAILSYLWFIHLQEAYPILLSPVAVHIFGWFGAKKWLLFLVMEHFTSLVPFLCLVVSMPLIFACWKKTLAVVVIGLTSIIVVHLAMSIALYHLYEAYGFSKTLYRITVALYLINDSLPIILWTLFYRKSIAGLFGLRVGGRVVPGGMRGQAS